MYFWWIYLFPRLKELLFKIFGTIIGITLRSSVIGIKMQLTTDHISARLNIFSFFSSTFMAPPKWTKHKSLVLHFSTLSCLLSKGLMRRFGPFQGMLTSIQWSLWSFIVSLSSVFLLIYFANWFLGYVLPALNGVPLEHWNVTLCHFPTAAAQGQPKRQWRSPVLHKLGGRPLIHNCCHVLMVFVI